MDDKIYLISEDINIVDNKDYYADLSEHFSSMPDIAKTLLKNAKIIYSKMEETLYSAPAFINIIRASLPEEVLQAILTEEQKGKIANGALKLMTKKDGTVMANLVNPKTNKIMHSVPLKSVKITPEISQAMTSYAIQMQMAQIAEQIQLIQVAVEEVRQGQEYDRLATAYSCQQKLFQSMVIKNSEIKTMALLSIAQDSEDSRNFLMQSQNANLEFIKNQPESFWGKFVSAAAPEKINLRMNEIRESLYAVNMVSLVEAMAYMEMGESDAARRSLEYYANFIQNTYLESKGLVERLDLIDPSKEKYWSKTLPNIKKKIQSLPCNESQEMGDGNNGDY